MERLMVSNCQTTNLVDYRRIGFLSRNASLELSGSLLKSFILKDACRRSVLRLLERKEERLEAVENRSECVSLFVGQLGEVNLVGIFLNGLNGTLILDEHSLSSCLEHEVSNHVKRILTELAGLVHKHDNSFLVLDRINIETILFEAVVLSDVLDKDIKSFGLKCDTRLEHLNATVIDFLVSSRHDYLERIVRNFNIRILIRNIAVTLRKVGTIRRSIVAKLVNQEFETSLGSDVFPLSIKSLVVVGLRFFLHPIECNSGATIRMDNPAVLC